MTLNVPEAEKKARVALATVEFRADAMLEDFLALAALARKLAKHADENTGHEPSVSLLARTLDEARAAGLLPARETAPAEPKEEA